VTDGRGIKAVIPGGASTPLLTAESLDVPMDFESLQQAGSALGTGAVVVMAEGTCMVDVARRTARFFAHESCGKCAPCRIASQRILDILTRLTSGEGVPADVDRLEALADGLAGTTFCPMGDAQVGPLKSSLRLFRDEFLAHAANGGCQSHGAPQTAPTAGPAARRGIA